MMPLLFGPLVALIAMVQFIAGAAVSEVAVLLAFATLMTLTTSAVLLCRSLDDIADQLTRSNERADAAELVGAAIDARVRDALRHPALQTGLPVPVDDPPHGRPTLRPVP